MRTFINSAAALGIVALQSTTLAQIQAAMISLDGQPDPAPVSAAWPVERSDQRISSPTPFESRRMIGRASTSTTGVECYSESQAVQRGGLPPLLPTRSEASVIWTDVVFASSAATASVALNLRISGVAQLNGMSDLEVSVLYAPDPNTQAQPVSTASWSTSPILTGPLAAYDGSTPTSFTTGSVTVATNTPVSIGFRLVTTSRQNWFTGLLPPEIISQSVEIDRGGAGGVFALHPGVSADSSQAGIAQNVSTPLAGIQFGASPGIAIGPSEPFELQVWNGVNARPVVLILTAVRGVPVFEFSGIAGFFDAAQRFSFARPGQASLAGQEFTLRAYTLTPTAGFEASRDHTIVFR